MISINVLVGMGHNRINRLNSQQWNEGVAMATISITLNEVWLHLQ